MKQIRLFYLLLIIVSANSNAQINTFEKCFNYGNTENGFSVSQTFDGGYIVSGRHGISLSVSNLLLIKTDSFGNEEWVKFITSGPYQHEGWCVKQVPDSGYIITGQADDIIGNAGDIYLVRTNKDGDTLWTKNYPNIKTDIGLSLESTVDGGFLIAGYKDTLACVIKTNNNGDTVWTRTYLPAGAKESQFSSVRQLSDSGFVMFGTTAFSSTSQGFYLVRTNMLGDTLWTRVFTGNPYRIGKAVDTTSGGGFILTSVKSLAVGDNSMIVLKLNGNGDTLWARTMGGVNNNDDGGVSIHEDSKGNFVVFGNTTTFASDAYDFSLIKLDSAGGIIWNKAFGGLGSQFGYSMQIARDGGFIMCGTTLCSNALSGVYLIKTDTAGTLVAGTSESSLHKTSIGIYPNPANDKIIISPADDSNIRCIELYDLSGRLIKSFPQQSTILNLDEISAGHYILRIITDHKVLTEKIIKNQQ